MSPTHFSIHNPLVVSGIAMALSLFGLFASTSLGVAITPNVNIPQAVVTTTYQRAGRRDGRAFGSRPHETGGPRRKLAAAAVQCAAGRRHHRDPLGHQTRDPRHCRSGRAARARTVHQLGCWGLQTQQVEVQAGTIAQGTTAGFLAATLERRVLARRTVR